MKRRDLLKLGGMAMAQAAVTHPALLAQAGSRTELTERAEGKADYTLNISPVTVEIDRSHILSTIGYNGTAPGPVLRMREGKTVTVDVINDTDTSEFVHWHGMLIPPELDGTEEEGSPPVPAHGRRRLNLRLVLPEAGGITPMPWRWTICTKAPIQASSVLSMLTEVTTRASTIRSFFSRCAIGSPSFPTPWKITMTTHTPLQPSKSQPH